MKQYRIKNPPELPASCPQLPEGYVYLGRGGSFTLPKAVFDGTAFQDDDSPCCWRHSVRWAGDQPDYIYAAPEGSEIITLNFGEPLGKWADKLPRPYVDLAVRRFAECPQEAKSLQHDSFVDLFFWDVTPESCSFWDRVDDFIDGTRHTLPAIPDSEVVVALQPVGNPEPKSDAPETPASEALAPKTLAEQIAAVEKRLAEQDAVLLQIKNLISSYHAKSSN
jgi:hypothetical protein